MTDQSVIYKICTRGEWDDAIASGEYPGAPIDVQDGFIHFSAKHQVIETAMKHFAGVPDLVLVSFDAAQFGDALKWEVSRGGDQFPHLYGELLASTAKDVVDLPLNEEGSHDFPSGI